MCLEGDLRALDGVENLPGRAEHDYNDRQEHEGEEA
jgi:hypothetical protein